VRQLRALAEIAEGRRRDAMSRSEHQASRIDEQNPDTHVEIRE